VHGRVRLLSLRELKTWFLALAALVVALGGLVPATVAASQPDGTRTFQELGYGDLTARTMYGNLNYFFPVPPGYAGREEGQLSIVFSHSPLLAPDRSTMTVAANGRNLESVFLSSENRSRARLSVPLPVLGPADKGIFVEILFSLRLTRDECEEAQNPALWATVHGDSTLTLRPRASEQDSLGLGQVDDLFVPVGQSPKPVTIVLPADPQPEEIDAAGLAAFQVGRWARSTGKDALVEIARTSAGDGPAIIVGGDSTLPQLELNGSLSPGQDGLAASGGVIPREHGVLALSQSSGPKLYITGGSASAIRDAADAMVSPQRRGLLTGDYSVLTGASVASRLSVPWQDGAASFAQLGVERRQVAGPGEHIIDLTFDRPAGWVLRSGSALQLAIESSPAVRGETSWIAIAVNGLEIGTRRLRPPGQGNSNYRFDLPADLLNSDLSGRPLRHLNLQIKVYLEVLQVGCTAASPASAWATLLPTSAWFLAYDAFTGRDLARFPAPFLGGAGVAPLSVVLPDRSSDHEMAAGLKAMAALGRWATDQIAVMPRLTPAYRLSDQDRQLHHLLLIGDPERNAISDAARQASPELFERDNPILYRLVAGEKRGELKVGDSPWARGLAVLVVTGEDPDGLVVAADSLTRRALLEKLRGRAAAVIGGMSPQALNAAQPEDAPPQSLAPRVETSVVDRLPAWQVTGAVLLGAFLSAVVVIGSTRWLRRGKR